MKKRDNRFMRRVRKSCSLTCALLAGLFILSCGEDGPKEDEGEKKVIPVEKITLDRTSYTFSESSEEQSIDIHFSPAGATVRKLTVTSSDEGVVKATGRLYDTKTDVTPVGYNAAIILITPVGSGTATVNVVADSQEISFSVTVSKDKVVAVDMNLEKEVFELYVSEESTKTVATFSPEDATVEKLDVSSSDESIVEVTGRLYNAAEHGRPGYDAAEIALLPKAAGEATVTVKADDVTRTFTVKVSEADPVYVATESAKEGTVKFNRATASLYVYASRIDMEKYSVYGIQGGIVYSSTVELPVCDGEGCTARGADFGIKMKGELTEGSYEVEMSGLNAEETYYYRAYLSLGSVSESGDWVEEIHYGEVKTFTTKSTPVICTDQVVDLGLSLKWAGWNIGATKPEEIGGYYAWGETATKETYSRSTWTATTETFQDAATANWGDNWRMPTLREMNELKYGCDWVPTTYNDVRGYMVVGPNDKAIFVPYSGMWASGYSSLQETEDCPLWTSEPSSAYADKALLLWLNYKEGAFGLPFGWTQDIVADCWTGCNVRAVYVGQ